jgi:Protein of unknown function (DUF2905)
MLSIARIFIMLGIIFLVVGGLLLLFDKLNLPIGRLPGDLHIESGSSTFYFPIATSLLLSVVLTIILNIIVRIFRK